jgi:hypothetical protein
MSPREVVVDTVPPETTSMSAREAAIALARSGAPMTGQELRLILGIQPSTFFYHQSHGHYDKLLLKFAAGLKKYSGVLVSRWLDGDPVFTPTFGRKNERTWTTVKQARVSDEPPGA